MLRGVCILVAGRDTRTEHHLEEHSVSESTWIWVKARLTWVQSGLIDSVHGDHGGQAKRGRVVVSGAFGQDLTDGAQLRGR